MDFEGTSIGLQEGVEGDFEVDLEGDFEGYFQRTPVVKLRSSLVQFTAQI